MDDDYVVMRDAIETLEERLLRSEALNAELARMLKDVEWAGRDCCPYGGGCEPACPDCGATKASGHDTICKLAALLKKAVTE